MQEFPEFVDWFCIKLKCLCDHKGIDAKSLNTALNLPSDLHPFINKDERMLINIDFIVSISNYFRINPIYLLDVNIPYQDYPKYKK